MPFIKSKLFLYQTEEEVRISLYQFAAYMVFVIVTTILGLSNPITYFFFFSQALEPLFLDKDSPISTVNSYEYLATVGEWWGVIENSFLQKVTIILKKEKSHRLRPTIRSFKIDENFLLGVPRLRQIRVLPGDCMSHSVLRTHFNNCYPSYKYSTEDTTPYYKGIRYYDRKEYKSLPFFGNAETYKGPGYMVFLSFNAEANKKFFKRMKDSKWIDEGTRLLLLEQMVYNIDTLIFGTIKLTAEVLPTGGIIPNWEIDMVPLYTIWSPHRPGILFTAIIFYLLVIYYTSVEIQEFFQSGPKLYLRRLQNIIDITILGTAYISLSLSMQLPFIMDEFLTKMAASPTALVNMDELHFWHITYVSSLATCVFMVWTKILRFIGFNKTLIQFQSTLLKCTKDILGFLIMFLIVFMAFALCGTMIFGCTNENYKTFQNALFSMVRMVLGDFQYKNIEFSNRILCPIFYLAYVLVISFILLNMFLAIINNTYIDVKQEITEGYSALKSFFVGIYKKIIDKFKRQKDKPENLQTVKSGLDYDQQSMFEFADVGFTNIEGGRRDSILSSLRSPFHKRYMASRGKHSGRDSINTDLMRLSERVEVLENLVNILSTNINSVLERT